MAFIFGFIKKVISLVIPTSKDNLDLKDNYVSLYVAEDNSLRGVYSDGTDVSLLNS